MKTEKINMITVLGPTATGKTGFATRLAALVDGEIISADSRQVYCGMDLGTGKDYEDYSFNGIEIPYHLIDIKDAGEEYNVFEFQRDFLRVYNDILSRGKMPILCGGTGMYLEAILNGYTLVEVPENKALREELAQKTQEELVGILQDLRPLHNTSDSDDRTRTIRAIEIEKFTKENPKQEDNFPKINSILFGLKYERTVIREKISKRLKERLDEGMIDEVRTLLDNGVHPDKLKYYGLEYKFLTMHVLGELNFKDMFQKLNTAIHQFAKRQENWFNRMEKNGSVIHWIDGNLTLDEKLEEAMKIISSNPEIKAVK